MNCSLEKIEREINAEGVELIVMAKYVEKLHHRQL